MRLYKLLQDHQRVMVHTVRQLLSRDRGMLSGLILLLFMSGISAMLSMDFHHPVLTHTLSPLSNGI